MGSQKKKYRSTSSSLFHQQVYRFYMHHTFSYDSSFRFLSKIRCRLSLHYLVEASILYHSRRGRCCGEAGSGLREVWIVCRIPCTVRTSRRTGFWSVSTFSRCCSSPHQPLPWKTLWSFARITQSDDRLWSGFTFEKTNKQRNFNIAKNTFQFSHIQYSLVNNACPPETGTFCSWHLRLQIW